MPNYSLRSGRRKLKVEAYRAVSAGIDANHVKWTDTSAALELVVVRLGSAGNIIDPESLTFMSRCSSHAIKIFLEQSSRNPSDMPHNQKILAGATTASALMLREALSHARALAVLVRKHDTPYNKAAQAEKDERELMEQLLSAEDRANEQNSNANDGKDQSVKAGDSTNREGGSEIGKDDEKHLEKKLTGATRI